MMEIPEVGKLYRAYETTSFGQRMRPHFYKDLDAFRRRWPMHTVQPDEFVLVCKVVNGEALGIVLTQVVHRDIVGWIANCHFEEMTEEPTDVPESR